MKKGVSSANPQLDTLAAVVLNQRCRCSSIRCILQKSAAAGDPRGQ
jgi:hypothetical protein